MFIDSKLKNNSSSRIKQNEAQIDKYPSKLVKTQQNSEAARRIVAIESSNSKIFEINWF